MAYAKRLQIEYDDINNIATRIEVWQEGYAGAVKTRNYASGNVCCEVSWGDSSTKQLPLVYGSQVTLYFDAETNFEFHDFFTSNSRKNKILVYKNGSLFHAAFGEADTWAEPFSYPPYEVSFTGYDGLGLLKDEDFLDENKDYYEGEKTPLEILTLLLAKTGLELPFNTAVSIRPSGASAGADALTQVLKDVYTYRDLSCYEVLEALFRGCRIKQREGEWWIVSNDLWNQSSVTFYKYTAAGAANGTVAKDTRFTGFWMEGDGDLSFLPAMKQMKVTQDYGYLGNIIKNNNFLSFEDGVFEYWTAVGITPAQRLYDGDGNRYVYLPGKETLPNWRDYARTKYLRSHGIRLEATTSIPTFTLDYALVEYGRHSAIVMFGIHLAADSGAHYNLKIDLDDDNKVIHVWEETTDIKGVPCEDELREYKTGIWPFRTTHRYANAVQTEGWRMDEVTEHFETKSLQIKEGIPAGGVLTVYLFLAQTNYAMFNGGACFRNIELKFLDEAEEEPPAETDFTIVNDLGNNYTPEDLTIINGSLPDIDNRLAIYHGGFILNDGSGAAVDNWTWDGGGLVYGYAELVARTIAAEMRLPRLFHQSVLADSVPALAAVWYDAVTAKYYLEAGIVYNDRMQAIEGRYVEVVDFDIDLLTVEREEVYSVEISSRSTSTSGARPGTGSSSTRRNRSTSGGRTGEIRNTNDELALFNEDYVRTGRNGRLASAEFRDITDDFTGRTRLDQTITRIIVDQVAHDFSIGEALRYDETSDLYVRAQADSEANAAVIGVVSDIYADDQFGLKSAGIVPDEDFLPGKTYVLSPTVAGAVVEKSAVSSWPEGSVQVKIGTGSSEGLSLNIDEIGTTGADGKSAYQIWLDEGNSGTEQDFLDSLVGADGTPGADGADGLSINWQGTYSVATAYVVNDAVEYNGSSYICIAATTGNDPTNATYWNLMAQKGTDGADGTSGADGDDGLSINWQGTYSVATAYVVNDAVEYNGSSYICIAPTTGNDPTNATYWNLMAQKGTDGTDGTPGADGSQPIQVTGITLLSTGWTLVSGLYEYDLADANITATSSVDVIPSNESIAIVIDAVIYPQTDSSIGSVKIYAENAPTGDISVTINIFEMTTP